MRPGVPTQAADCTKLLLKGLTPGCESPPEKDITRSQKAGSELRLLAYDTMGAQGRQDSRDRRARLSVDVAPADGVRNRSGP